MLLEQLAATVRFNEPLLPVGETGTGKTASFSESNGKRLSVSGNPAVY